LHTFANLCFALPEVISVNPNKPECNGPFLIYRVPNFDGAKPGTEFKGFYIMLGINKDFLEIDDSTNWFSATVTGTQHILFRMPAFPYALWPWLKGNVGEQLMRIILDQVPEPVQKAMNHAHSVFSPDSDTAQSMETLSRQWKYFLLDFSGVKDVGELSAKVLFADAGDKEVLDYDVIEVPVTVDNNLDVLHSEYLLGFKVGCIDPDGSGGGRKVARQNVKKSVLANKLASRKRTPSNSTNPDAVMSSPAGQH
jgi:hypothetical protein